MYLSPVSSVRFGDLASAPSIDKEAALNRPQTHQRAQEAQAEQKPAKKKSSVAKKIGIGLGVVAAAALVLAGLKHFNVVAIKEGEQLANANFFQKIPHYMAKAGDAIINAGNGLVNTVKGWFHKNPTEVVEEVVEAVEAAPVA